MFIKIVTNRGEIVALNVSRILFITPNKNKERTEIVDVGGMDYLVDEPFDSLFNRLNNIQVDKL